MTDQTNLNRTPLYERHKSAGGRLTPFAGYELPTQYTGVIEEHNAVRQNAGIFDVSHMGEIVLSGPGSLEAADNLVSNKVAALEDGRACYTGILTEQGTFVDDVIAYRFSENRVLFCVNAANHKKVLAHIRSHTTPHVEVIDESNLWAQLAVQGPKAVSLVDNLSENSDLASIKRFRFTETTVAGVNAVVARTGYTGEDGFEIYCSKEDAVQLWDAIVSSGAIPCGLGARDTLRLEASLALYGNDIDEEHTPLEAGMSWTVKFDKDHFIGKAALVRQKEEGLKQRLVGFELTDRGIPRKGMNVLNESGDVVGQVTSGTKSPTLNKAIGMAYVIESPSQPETLISIDVRGKPLGAKIISMPFYKRS